MEFSVDKEILLSALQKIDKAITGRSNQPILEGVLISANSNILTLKGTDSEIYITTNILANIISPGEIVVSETMLLELIKKMPNSLIHIKKNRDMLKIKCLNTEFNIIIMPSNDYPVLPEVTEGINIEFSQKNFREMIKGTAFAAANDEIRPILQGILIEINKSDITLVSLDGYRMAIKTESLESNIDNKSFVVSAKCLLEISKLLEGKDNVQINFTNNHLIINMENTMIVIKLLQGQYLNYRSLLPKDNVFSVKVKREEMIKSIERISLVGRTDRANLIKLSSYNENLVVKSNSQIGKAKEELEASIPKEIPEIAFNSKYLLDALKCIEDNEVVFEFKSSTSPCIIQNEKSKYIILPVRVVNN